MIRWWQHPLTLVAWSVACLVYASATTRAGQVSLPAFIAWGVGCLAWMIAGVIE